MGKKKLISLISLALIAIPVNAVDLPQYLNFDGQLADDSGSPITTNVSVAFKILNDSASCVLYDETRSITPDAGGHFSVKIGPDGGGTRNTAADGGLLWKNIFQNDAQVRTHDSTYCSGGFTPAVGEARKLRVYVSGIALSPDYILAPVPHATVAETLQGKTAADFLSASGNSSLNGFLKFNNTNEIRFSDVATNYVGFRAPGGLSSNQIWSLPALDGTNGQVLQTNGAGQLGWATPSSSGISTLNGLAGSAQTFNTGTGGASPNWSSAGAIHTLNIPAASSPGTSAGLISYADWNSFNNKQNSLGFTPLNSAGGTMTGVLTMSANLDMNANRIINLQNPSAAQDAATKNYVDSNFVQRNGDVMPGALSVSSFGTPTVPSLNINGHGLFSPGGTALGFATAGSERMRIDSGGFVGIGTATPGQNLSVVGTTPGVSGAVSTQIENTNSTGAARMTVVGDWPAVGGVFSMEAYGTSTAYGNVNPSNVRNAGGASLFWEGTGGPLSIAAKSTYIRFYTGGETGTEERMRIDNSGNVGIGTTAPSATLDVNGNLKVGPTGTPVQQIRNFSGMSCSFAPATISANGTGTCTFSVGSVAPADNASVNCQPGSVPAYPMVHSCYISGSSQITLVIHNAGGGGLTPPSSWNITVIKF